MHQQDVGVGIAADHKWTSLNTDFTDTSKSFKYDRPDAHSA